MKDICLWTPICKLLLSKHLVYSNNIICKISETFASNPTRTAPTSSKVQIIHHLLHYESQSREASQSKLSARVIFLSWFMEVSSTSDLLNDYFRRKVKNLNQKFFDILTDTRA